MKTIKMNDEIKRVKECDAKQVLPTGWKYVSKSEWKKVSGNKKEVVEVGEVVEEVKKESKYKQKKGRNAD